MSRTTDRTPELAQLYRRLAPRLRRILGANLSAPACVLDDACQMAWTALLAEPIGADEARVLSWLATTARREALGMLRRADTELRVIASASPPPDGDDADLERAAEFWDRLGEIRRLSRRQQQMLWMRGMGYGYREIASRTGGSERTVERQLTEARRRLAAAA